eukprot:TRINITY_DN548_c0_g1_i1.p3 TRINITY_DN548_c0_g1~~TRINITY_DN548_c0_g1_i1.p3  ORF type:complete len:264 (-),score=33.44 TRINITY_DN548_c0_g1_i1:109-900(-)
MLFPSQNMQNFCSACRKHGTFSERKNNQGSSEERLLGPKQTRPVAVEVHTFAPQINPISNKLDNRMKYQDQSQEGKVNRWETLYEMDKKKKEKLELMKAQEQARKEEEENFTFKPQLVSKMNTSQRAENNATVEQRNQIWERLRAQKVKDMKEKGKEKELEGCTFAPKLITQYKGKENTEIVNSGTVKEGNKGEEKRIDSLIRAWVKRDAIPKEEKARQKANASVAKVLRDENVDFKEAISVLHQNLMAMNIQYYMNQNVRCL